MPLTPMMIQYMEIKEKYKDFLLFYRLGDFYELFFEDAQIGSRELDLILTGKECGEEKRAPMCGMPFHSVDNYIYRLVEKGYKIAICEQMEDPALAKGIVKREVIRIITPGTVIESGYMNDTKNNYLCALFIEEKECSAAFFDITTGIINVTYLNSIDYLDKVLNEIGIYMPSETLVNCDMEKYPKIEKYLKEKAGSVISNQKPELFDYVNAVKNIEKNFHDKIKISDTQAAVINAVGAIIEYLRYTQKSDLLNLNEINIYDKSIYMELDINTRRNLEIVETMRNKEKKGALLYVLDKTKTAKGARLLRQWTEKPLLNCRQIEKRQKAIGELLKNPIEKNKMADSMKSVLDIDKILTKIIYKSSAVKDLVRLSSSIENIPAIKELLSAFSSEMISEINRETDTLSDIKKEISDAIIEELPPNPKEGGYIRGGYNADVDHLRSIVNDNMSWIEKIEAEEREKTGIKTLKIAYNKVFGYYIEVTKSYLSQVPDRYIRKQTLTNCERYVTEEIKDMETEILGASEKLLKLEEELKNELEVKIAENIHRFQKTSNALATLDVLYSLAEAAEKNSYICPEVDYSAVINIKDGRHPVVEQLMEDSHFVPNDVELDNDKNRLSIITGPNMAGKSTYMRQVAICVLMAQMGSYIPASQARIGIVDKIFTRVGASDDLAAGQSTFMIEMSEVSHIIKNATKSSLIIYDEIGRGTSTFDGMSIARAILEYTASKKELGAKTLFATHYHELTELENKIDGVKNYNITAKKRNDDIVFLRKIVRGAADDSYGIEVAKLAGIPNSVIKNAKEILSTLEDDEKLREAKTLIKTQAELIENDNFSISDYTKQELYDKIKMIDINVISPIEAFNLLYDLKKIADKF